jgi:DNA repair protein RecN (Recombination protein N)
MRAELILHTSQHGQQKLLQPSFQAAILDDFLARPDLLKEKECLTRALADCAARMAALDQARLALEDKREVLEYQQQEIEKVAPRAGEEEELELRRASFRNQAGIVENAAAALGALQGNDDGPGLYRHLSALEKAVEALAGMLDEFSGAPETLVELRASVRDLEGQLRRAARGAEQEADIEAIEARLFTLAQLKRKLKRPLESIVALQREIAENLDFLDTSKLERGVFEQEERELCAALAALLAVLNPARQEAAERLAQALQEELTGLGFSEHVRVLFEFSPQTLYAGPSAYNGTCGDCVELKARLFWQPNPGQPPQPLDRIASGGELSRFLLAVVSLMSKNAAERPTLIFDEVDSGVGGLTLNRVADSLERLAASRQMLLITHWPQLAARAQRHFVVEKEVIDGQTYTSCTRLAPSGIPAELSRMSGTVSDP